MNKWIFLSLNVPSSSTFTFFQANNQVFCHFQGIFSFSFIFGKKNDEGAKIERDVLIILECTQGLSSRYKK
jgi:hypothetical protein